MHEEAFRHAREALHSVKVNGARQRFTDEAADAMVRAALVAFLAHVKVSEAMQATGERAVDLLPPSRSDEESVAFRAMLAQLSREL